MFFKTLYTFSVTNQKLLRTKFNYKICYKHKYNFLKLKYTPSIALANRLMRNGKFLKIFKLLKKHYYGFLLFKNFKNIPVSSNFLFFYQRYFSFRDIDRVLFWKYKQLDCMFTNKVKKIKKKKKQFSKLFFLIEAKRIPLCINFLKYTILLKSQRKKKNLVINYFSPLTDFIITNKINTITKIKYKIYKQKLMLLQL